VVKTQRDIDDAIRELYIAMMETLTSASKDDVLKRHAEFKQLFNEMIHQSVDCSHFISEYASGNYLSMLI
jgi:hypothetical protein